MSTRLDFATLSLMDALDLAILIESEAYERYQHFVRMLGHRYAGDPASVFASMAENEKKHGVDLMERRKALFGTEAMRVSPSDLYDVEAPEQGAVRTQMSALQAFEIALSSEQKALEFYQLALPHVSNPEVVELFTELRDEEVEHVRLVRDCIAGLPESAKVKVEEDEDEYPAL